MPAGIQEMLSLLLFPAALFTIMYFMLIRPQKKKEKSRREMQNSIKVGEEIVTIGGIMGKVINIKDDEITIETSVERTQIKIFRFAIDSVTSSEHK
ncbi:MAG: preprotein translocase subunit YajC [Clostridiaceae bacterium]|jgi:preprotein translocase subunit YajC|nr:preprotein translocase subunit YajC [Clostridiaceae bacterium]